MLNNKLLSVKNLSKTYHDLSGEIKAIDNISFDLYDKEFVSIIGPSGCGKSTILSIIGKIDNEYDGKIKNYKNVKVGYMLQTDSLFPWKNILDNCLIGLKVNNKLDIENKNYVCSLLKKYGLEDFMYKYPDSLSGGMKQRVALIRTLALKPDVLLLDEPLSALDFQSRLSIGKDILKIIKNEGKTAIMVTHNIDEALNMSDRIFVLTKSPGTIKNIYEIDFSNDDYFSKKKNSNYTLLEDKIWRDLDVQL